MKTRKDGTVSLRQLRKLAKDNKVSVYNQGGSWVSSVWSESMGAWMENPMHYSVESEYQALAKVLARRDVLRSDYTDRGDEIFFEV